MSQAASVGLPPAGRCVRLSDVDWATYTRLLRVFEERPGVRLTYDRGELEIMSPLLEHDNDCWLLGDLIFVLTEELNKPLKRGGRQRPGGADQPQADGRRQRPPGTTKGPIHRCLHM